MIVREYALGKAYETTSCNILDIGYKNEINCMFCGTGSKEKTKKKGAGACTPSQLPCLQVMVAFQANGKTHKGLLHPDSLQARGAHGQVSQTAVFYTLRDHLMSLQKGKQ